MILFSYHSFRDIPTEEQERFKQFLEFCIETLLHKQKKSKKIYHINFFFYEEMEGLGEVEVESEASSRGKYKEYCILFSKKCRKQKLLSTLAHELTHVKQYCKGELNFGESLHHTMWKDKIYDEREIPYWLHPWEIEAYGFEKCLYEMWLEKIRKDIKPGHWLLK